MNILYLCSDLDVPVFGHKRAAIHLRELASALQELGHDVLIASPNAGGIRPRDWKVRILDIPPDPIERLTLKVLDEDPSFDPMLGEDFRALMSATRMRASLDDALIDFRPDVIYERYSLFSLAGVSLAWSLGIPLVIEVTGRLAQQRARDKRLHLEHFARVMERIVLASADRVVVVSEPLWTWVVGMGIDPDRVCVVDMGRNTTLDGITDPWRANADVVLSLIRAQGRDAVLVGRR